MIKAFTRSDDGQRILRTCTYCESPQQAIYVLSLDELTYIQVSVTPTGWRNLRHRREAIHVHCVEAFMNSARLHAELQQSIGSRHPGHDYCVQASEELTTRSRYGASSVSLRHLCRLVEADTASAAAFGRSR